MSGSVELIRDDENSRVDVLLDGALFTSYLYPDTLKKPVLHPLRTASGVVVTRGYPLDPQPRERTDHPHQVGVWFNYGNVNGYDFWNNSAAIPEERRDHYGTIRHREIASAQGGATEGRLEVTMDWLGPDGRALLAEETTYRFAACGDTRVIDRVAALTALDEDVLFADDKEGMLGIRVAHELESPDAKPAPRVPLSGAGEPEKYADTTGVNGLYRSSTGLEGDAVWGTRADWMKLSATKAGRRVTVALLDHPQNPGYPTYWHARGYGLFAANTLGQAALSGGKDSLNLSLEPGDEATFRYRILVHDTTELTDDALNEEFRQFAQTE